MDGRLLRGSRAAVDADVLGEQILLRVVLGEQVLLRLLAYTLVEGDETARRLVADLVVEGLSLAVAQVTRIVGVRGIPELLQRRIGPLLGQPVVQALALPLLARGRALVLDAERTLGRRPSLVVRVRSAVAEGVLRVEDALVLPVLGPSGWYTSSPMRSSPFWLPICSLPFGMTGCRAARLSRLSPSTRSRTSGTS
uniref:Uncharacterized protein n=1 Tax=Streptomyces avermitilis TaxID=33903 RepID=A0A499W8Q3_STRAX|nr:hypothetical protein SAVMC3_83660 [Streptomyces avermitilis]